ncbi:hypothetical protein [Natrarchaeobaculum sulfurireducens]|uniref:Uncharacterized protein n=1 Tax=Natrarchaeobaculum sulfurireducens TaxID=2044521 RepID=A0A346PM39_9EURY|nr:hypothetical protein [Natrarchaeobaculum sulfurireducens]AXR76918.1 hypothetical protein AArc1_0574 [Natrarchaeobaculum sulfurireducens]AXR80584.1 hypothetical protein AArcMg_0561 [Natrarchaeobaculum sulfurireducens]
MFVDRERLERRLREEFGGSSGEARVVVRQAVDLADSNRYESHVGSPLTTDLIIEELADAPDGTPADRWNWWIGSLELAFGEFGRFTIRQYRK